MKRWIFTILLFLLLGAVVNVAVAWSLALWSDQDEYESRVEVPVPLVWPSYMGRCNWPSPNSVYRLTGVGPGVTTVVFVGSLPIPPRTGEAVSADAPRVCIYCYRFGLPMRALEWQSPRVGGVSRAEAGPILDPAYEAAGLRTGLGYPEFIPVGETSSFRRLPLAGIWPGSLVNSMFYAIILWLLIPGPFVLRRRIRIKRGRCPKCGYDLRGKHDAGCPECGWNRPLESESARS